MSIDSRGDAVKGLSGQAKRQLATAAGVGATVAVVAWFAGPHLAAVLSGVGGFTTTLAIHGWLWLRKMFGIGVGVGQAA